MERSTVTGRWMTCWRCHHRWQSRALDLSMRNAVCRFRVLRLVVRYAVAAVMGAVIAGIATPAVQATSGQDPDLYALVLADLHRETDAASFAQFLVEVRGFNRENVVVLFEPTHDEMIRLFGDSSSYRGSLHEFLSDPQRSASEVVVFYSGYGLAGVDDREYVAAAGEFTGSVHDTALPLEHLITSLGNLPVKSVSVFLDLCSNNNSYGRDSALKSQLHRTAGTQSGETDQLTLLVTACGEEFKSWRSGDLHYRTFTHHLLTALYGQADSDGNGSITGLEVQRYLDLRFSLDNGHAYGRPQAVDLYGNAEIVFAPKTDAELPVWPQDNLMSWPRSIPRNQPFTVRTNPAGAQVRILGVDAARGNVSMLLWSLRSGWGHRIEDGYSDGMLLPPADYHVSVSAQGYESVSQTVRHGPETATTHRIELRQIGRLWTSSGHFTDCEYCPDMVVVQAGSCQMGCVSGMNCNDEEKPVHNVRIDRPFALSVHKVSIAEWEKCVAEGGCEEYLSDIGSSSHRDGPVTNVSWHDAKSYVSWLAKETANSYRLPSEAEWEYATRAGAATSHYPIQDEGSMEIEEIMVTVKRQEDPQYPDIVEIQFFEEMIDIDPVRDAPVISEWCMVSGCVRAIGSEAPGASCKHERSGLLEMNRVAWEWLEDCWNPNYKGAPSDGSAWLDGDCSQRLSRGDPSASKWKRPRAATRNRLPANARGPYTGFRIAVSFDP